MTVKIVGMVQCLLIWQKQNLLQNLCIRNFIKRYGCILAISEKNLDREIKILNLNFISNNGTKGTEVQVQNLRISMQNSRIINNFAFDRGEGINFNLNSNRFLLNQIIICQNSALERSGIFLQGNSSLNLENFSQITQFISFCYFIFNNINE
ncbi:unnamed protein product [Paramecium primaurelia]|uniref:Uncharacterized protein n=1 Tax=Paramecium primaurelia TaxID=5886 RepID=A0A8S1JRP6_PARPR|nr:unnamed protein product [Paramecium primaurelia]CAD8081400.1 unnamed protein product [Paramecium primaurelia]